MAGVVEEGKSPAPTAGPGFQFLHEHGIECCCSGASETSYLFGGMFSSQSADTEPADTGLCAEFCGELSVSRCIRFI